jgi:branched-chain amino acid transport system substrate-binding protein
MKKALITGIIMVLIAGMLFAGGDSDQGKTGSADEPIRIGVTAPLTGPVALNGQLMKQAIDMAVDDVNNAGGLLGRKVQIFYEDDQATANYSVNAVNKQIFSNKVFAMIGPTLSGNVLAIEQLAAENKLLVLAGVTSPKVPAAKNPWVFTVRANDSLSAKIAFKFSVENLKAKKIGLLHVNDDFGNGALQVIQDYSKEINMPLACVEGLNTGDKDMSGQLLKMKTAGVDAMIVWCHDAEGGIIARQYKEFGLDKNFAFVGTGVFSLQQWYNIVSPEVADGIYSINDYIANNPAPNVQEFHKRYTARYNMSTDLYSAYSWDAIHLLFEGIKRAGVLDTDKVRQALLSMPEYTGVMTVFKFDSSNSGSHQILVVRNKGLTPEVVTTVKE